MAKRPPGLKVYRTLLNAAEVEELRTKCRSLAPPPHSPLFRYFGSFGDGARRIEPVEPWMVEWATKYVEAGIFPIQPNQHRVTNWRGDLSAHFKWHIDNQRHGEEILAICITGARRIGFRDPKRSAEEPFLLDLEAGDAYLIRGGSRWKWEHKVMPVGQDKNGGESFVLSYRR